MDKRRYISAFKIETENYSIELGLIITTKPDSQLEFDDYMADLHKMKKKFDQWLELAGLIT